VYVCFLVLLYEGMPRSGSSHSVDASTPELAVCSSAIDMPMGIERPRRVCVPALRCGQCKMLGVVDCCQRTKGTDSALSQEARTPGSLPYTCCGPLAGCFLPHRSVTHLHSSTGWNLAAAACCIDIFRNAGLRSEKHAHPHSCECSVTTGVRRGRQGCDHIHLAFLKARAHGIIIQ